MQQAGAASQVPATLGYGAGALLCCPEQGREVAELGAPCVLAFPQAKVSKPVRQGKLSASPRKAPPAAAVGDESPWDCA